ncbi:lysophospholipase [Aggregicoccus sp. 17bor-14]|uniref:alpha/beta hydrolase n=1 Tax=Myxococcaceae TaxID=31 RepID=UPI00129CE7FD|nr:MULTISPECIES: alpha/beta hydrolase [Myxococcaceae]MBF5045569.1 lysophospholipase [Simulacricoccus sp. 17bor-14]MRI91306.1 lysophospholipase [Aggregicoccus sp. 17bor-14]
MPHHDEGFFNAKDNLRLFWVLDVPEAPRAHVALVHGYGDHSGRYRPAIEALVADGFAVHSFDYRGHGRADGRRGHAERWQDFVDDLEVFWARVRRSAGAQKTFLLGHSHGGLMALQWLSRDVQGLSGLVLSAPYLQLALSPPALKVAAARVVGTVLPWLPIKSGLKAADLTRDEAIQAATLSDPLYLDIATPGWFTQSSRAQVQTLASGPSVKVPLFLFCGEKDGVASTVASRAFFESVASADKTYKEYPGMRHEPLNEVGRDEVFRDISGWISRHL